MQSINDLRILQRSKSQRYAPGVTAERLESRVVLSAGTLDPTFGTDGVASGELFSPLTVNALAVQNGKIIVASSPTLNYNTVASSSLGLARFNANGSLDPTFGTDGAEEPPFGGSQGGLPAAAAVEPDGKIVVVGLSGFLVARYLPDGAVDPTFGQGGSVEILLPAEFDQALAVAIQGDGKIVVAGDLTDASGQQSAVVRVLPNGALD